MMKSFSVFEVLTFRALRAIFPFSCCFFFGPSGFGFSHMLSHVLSRVLGHMLHAPLLLGTVFYRLLPYSVSIAFKPSPQ